MAKSYQGSRIMYGELVPCGGGSPIPLRKPKLLVGRQSFCDIALRFPTISSRHCELELVEGYWFVKDLGSSNGIRVNGDPCESKCLLPKDILWIAKYRFEVFYTPPPDRPPPQTDERTASIQGSLLEKAGIANAEGASKKPEPVSASSSLGELVPCGGGDPILLQKPLMVIGRHGSCDIPIRHSTVSARHCELEMVDGYWVVRDLGSSNGIKVDGVRCDSKCLLPGNVLWVATYRYQIEYTPKGDGPPPDTQQRSFARSLLEKAGLARRKAAPPAVSPPRGNEALPESTKDDDDHRKRWSVDD
jgi:adenylate cyclase